MDAVLAAGVLNAVGPITAAVVGTVIIGGIAQHITQRAQDRRAYRELRHTLAFEMAEAAYDLYFRTEHHARWVQHTAPGVEQLALRLQALDTVYANQRVAMGSLQTRLDVYFDKGRPSRLWHQVIDLLSALFFTAANAADSQLQELLSNVQGEKHTKLTLAELRGDRAVLVERFGEALGLAVTSVLSDPLRAAGGRSQPPAAGTP